MTALRNLRIAVVRAPGTAWRAAPPWQRERAFRPLPTRRSESPARTRRARAVARLVRVGAEVLFGLWTVAVLSLFICVAIALVR
jgi:hypothetical protein